MSVALRERIAELEEEVRQLREIIIPSRSFPPELGLTPSETKVLSFILARAPHEAHRRRIHSALYPDPDDEADVKTVDIFVFRIRRALGKFGLSIRTSWGNGYYLEARDAALLRDWLDCGAPPSLETSREKPLDEPRATLKSAAVEDQPRPAMTTPSTRRRARPASTVKMIPRSPK